MATLLVCSATDDLSGLCIAFEAAAGAHAEGLKVVLWPAAFDPEEVIAVAAWHPPAGLLPKLPNLKFVASIGAGIEHLLQCPDLPAGIPITRIVDSQQAQGMADYVLWATLFFHRGFDRMLVQQAQHIWHMPAQATSSAFRVGIMGLGGMGTEVAKRLRDNGFAVSAWARSAHVLDGVQTFAGDSSLTEFLATPDLVVCLLPLTTATAGLCNARFFASLKQGAAFLNAGRGQQVVMEDLIGALDSGHLRGAVLDVFDAEPLSPHSPLWSHPKVVVTPHMASAATDARIASQIISNVQRVRHGQAIENLVAREQGY
jgi:glyoxylate/hydroxypyruvate reductase A